MKSSIKDKEIDKFSDLIQYKNKGNNCTNSTNSTNLKLKIIHEPKFKKFIFRIYTLLFLKIFNLDKNLIHKFFYL